MRPIAFRPRRSALVVLLSAAMLAACGGGVDSDDAAGGDDDEAVTIDTAGRIVTTEKDAATLRVHDLDAGSVEATHTLDHVPSALYASPGGRYAVVAQRTQGQVQFVDAGIWQEDHGDHLHDYKQASSAVAWKLSGARPTHYDMQAGVQSAFFMDGDSTASPVQNAGVRLITDASIASGSAAASLDLAFPIHGLGEPVGNKLLTVSRAGDAADTLPTHLNLYQRSGSSYNFVRELPTRCDGMHGSYSSGQHTVAGCSTGMLLVRHVDEQTVSEQLVTTPLRVGTVAGHAKLLSQFIGVASEGAAPSPVTTRFYALDGETGTVTELVPQGWETGRVRRTHGFDRSGQRFFIVDDQGTLIVSQRQGGVWASLSRTTAAVPVMPTAAPWPAITANGARDEIYITDPVAQQLIVVNSASGAVIERRALGFAPASAVWLGITR